MDAEILDLLKSHHLTSDRSHGSSFAAHSSTAKAPDLKMARKPAFIFSVGAAFLSAGGNLLPDIFLPQFSVVLGYSAAFGAALLAISNGVASAPQTLTGFAGDKFGHKTRSFSW